MADVGIEAGKAVGFTGLGMALLKVADLLLKKVEHYRAAQATEGEETWKNAAQLREELRKDKEAERVEKERERTEKEKLRGRLDLAEKRIDDLEEELHTVREENERLRTELERVETAMRLPKGEF